MTRKEFLMGAAAAGLAGHATNEGAKALAGGKPRTGCKSTADSRLKNLF